MAEHHAAVTVDAPAHDVFALFTHFNDYPKFMSYVKEVTYLDERRSHWVVDMLGEHQWDAVNEDWIAGRQIGWRSTSGIVNSGRVTFTSQTDGATRVSVEIRYEPPAGVFGAIGETLGAGLQFEHRLQHDLENFAAMVRAAPPGSLDPTSSSYLFHVGSAAAAGRTTLSQDQTMGIGDLPQPAGASESPSTTGLTQPE